MICSKCFGILVEVEGEGRALSPTSPESHVIGKPKPYRGSTRMNADQEWGWKAERAAPQSETETSGVHLKVYANLG